MEINYLIIYWCVAGFISAIWSYYKLTYKPDDEVNDIISQLEYMGIDRKNIIRIVAAFELLLGGVNLPLNIFNKIYKFFTGKDLT